MTHIPGMGRAMPVPSLFQTVKNLPIEIFGSRGISVSPPSIILLYSNPIEYDRIIKYIIKNIRQ